MTTLLLVDDDALSRQVLADMIKVHGHEVLLCADASMAMDVLSGPRGRVHAVISDVRMPGMDGIELARRIRQKLPEMPIALMSAEPDFSIYEEAASRGLRITIMLQKPFQPRSVQRVLEQLLGEAASGTPSTTRTSNPPEAPAGAVPVGKDDAPAWLGQPALPFARLPPARIWFVAARRRVTGRLILSLPGRPVSIGLRSGQWIVETGGSVPPAKTPMELARWMLDLQDGAARFEACESFELGGTVAERMSVPDAVSAALAAVPHVTIQHAWRSVSGARAFARSPKDSHPEAWGLDAVATQVHEAAKGQRVEALVTDLARRSPSFRNSGFRTLEMLARLNLLTLLA